MDHFDGQGHHMRIRPYIPNRKREHSKLKSHIKVRIAPWQLAMMMIGAIGVAKKRIPSGKLDEMKLLLANENTWQEPGGGDFRCGEVGNYAMLQTVPSRPPPQQVVCAENETIHVCELATETATQHGHLVELKQRLQRFFLFRILVLLFWGTSSRLQAMKRFPFSTTKSLTRILPLGALMAIATHCTKEPQPNPNPGPIYPPIDTTICRDTVTIDWNWDNSIGFAPPKYMIQEYTNKPNVRTVLIKMTSPNSSGYTPRGFHRARDTLQTRIDIHPQKVRGSGTIYINNEPGADSMPNHEPGQGAGIAWYDKQWFEQNGWQIKPLPHSK